MIAGELFVNLGIKGAEKTISALSNVTKGVGDLGSMSLEAKAGIVGALYALEQFFAASGRTGTSLTNLNSLVGTNARTLQQYEYAARQVGMSNQDMDATFKSLQSSMTKVLTSEGVPRGLARLGLLTGQITTKDVEQFAKSPELLLQRLQQYAQREKNVGLRNEMLRSFGISDAGIAALNRQTFRPEVMNKAPTYSDKEIVALDRANIAWSNLGLKIEMAVGHFNALHGGQLVGDISKLTDQILKFAGALTNLAEKFKVFEGVGKIFEGWTKIFEQLNKGFDKETVKDVFGWIGSAFTPSSPALPSTNNSTNQNVTNNITVHNHGVKDSKDAAHHFKQEMNRAGRQFLNQGLAGS